jgi:SAM-dependent methyltransferase
MRCDVCGGETEQFLPFRGVLADNALEVEGFAGKWIWKCQDCGHSCCQPKPAPELLERYYRVDFWRPPSLKARIRRKIRSLISWTLRLEPRASSQLQCLRPFLTPCGDLRVLEIGAGPASFTRLIKRDIRSSHVDVVEPGEDWSDIYRAARINRIARRFEDLPELIETYDVVHASQWLEHMADPRAVFQKIRALLKPGGILFIEVPNCQDPYFEYRFFPDPPHLQFFTPGSLSRLADECRLEVKYLGTGGRPMEMERTVGYLAADTAETISSAERCRLDEGRRERARQVQDSDSNQNAGMDAGLEAIRLVAGKPVH